LLSCYYAAADYDAAYYALMLIRHAIDYFRRFDIFMPMPLLPCCHCRHAFGDAYAIDVSPLAIVYWLMMLPLPP